MPLNTSDSNELVSFLSANLAYSSPKVREQCDKLITGYDDGLEMDVQNLAAAARELAVDAYPMRYAINRFFAEEGAMIEWDKVLGAVRRSTAYLLERFRTDSGVHSLDGMLAHEDADTVIREEELHEIQAVRQHIREDYVTNNRSHLEELAKEGKQYLREFMELMETWRHTAEGLPELLQVEAYRKVTAFEDKVLYDAAHIPLAAIQDELSYYTEQKEVPVEE